jgi:hypothetical protein
MDETVMNQSKKRFFLYFALCSFATLCLCCRDALYSHPENRNTFSNDLLGKWVSNGVSNQTVVYSGTLVIDYETITIDGYGEDWASILGDDSKRPFVGFPRRAALKGYSQEGKIFIINYANGQNGIPYKYSEEGSYPDRKKFLSFDFGGRTEIVEWKKDS